MKKNAKSGKKTAAKRGKSPEGVLAKPSNPGRETRQRLRATIVNMEVQCESLIAKAVEVEESAKALVDTKAEIQNDMRILRDQMQTYSDANGNRFCAITHDGEETRKLMEAYAVQRVGWPLDRIVGPEEESVIQRLNAIARWQGEHADRLGELFDDKIVRDRVRYRAEEEGQDPDARIRRLKSRLQELTKDVRNATYIGATGIGVAVGLGVLWCIRTFS